MLTTMCIFNATEPKAEIRNSIELKIYKQFYRTGELVKTTVILFLIRYCWMSLNC